MTYTCEFFGRRVGAEGVFYDIVHVLDAEKDATFDEIRIKLYEYYEHIMRLTVNGKNEEDWYANHGN